MYAKPDEKPIIRKRAIYQEKPMCNERAKTQEQSM